MMVLGIETATETTSVGLCMGGQPAGEVTREAGRTLSRELTGMIDELLQSAGVEKSGLEAVAVSIGPGSFTGLRIGLAAAKGLALARDLPLVPVRTLDALAGQAAASGLPLKVIQRARKTEVYHAVYTPGNGGPVKKGPETVMSIDELIADGTVPAVYAGNAAAQHAERLKQELGENFRYDPESAPRPSGSTIACLGARQLAEGEPSDFDTLEPYYIKEPDAKKMER